MNKPSDTGVAKTITEADTEEIGEGNHAADRRYREATEKFIADGKVDGAAREAQRAIEDEREGRELKRAEESAKKGATEGATERGRSPAGRSADGSKPAASRP
jgi:hypothetical protein